MKRRKAKAWTEWRVPRVDGTLTSFSYLTYDEAREFYFGRRREAGVQNPIRVRVTEILPRKKRKVAK